MKLPFLALALAVLVRAEAQEIHIHGAMKATMRQGQLGGTWTAEAGHSRYALGPLAYLRGEVTQWNDTIWTSHVGAKGELIVQTTARADLPFSAHADLPKWHEVPPIRAKNLADLESQLTPYLKDGPTFIKLQGRLKFAEIHAVNLPEGRSVSSPEEAHEGKTTFILKSADVQILAFASRSHRGILTHHDTDFHLHLLSRDRRWMGHVDALGRGTFRVWIP
jgi:acetolactate decarboxylase